MHISVRKKRKPGNPVVDFLHLLYESVYFQEIIQLKSSKNKFNSFKCLNSMMIVKDLAALCHSAQIDLRSDCYIKHHN